MNSGKTSLRRCSSGQPADAEIFDDITDEHLDLWRAQWVPFAQAALSARRLQRPASQMPEDFHWDWKKKTDWSRSLMALQRFSLTCDGELQGLMLLDLTKYSKLPSQVGRHIAYVAFVATAPWNRPDFVEHPRFRGVGLALMRVAVEVSREESFRGRVGLHSLPQACQFYREVCGMSDLGSDASYDKLTYFEMTESQANTFCAPPNTP